MIYLKGLLDKLEPYFLEHSNKEYLYVSKEKPNKSLYSISHFHLLYQQSTGRQLYKIPSDVVIEKLNISNDFLHRVIVGKWDLLEVTRLILEAPSNNPKARRYFYYDDVMELAVFLEHYKLFRLVNDQRFQQSFPKYSHKSFKKFYTEFTDGKDIYSDRIKNFCKNVLENKYSKGSK